MLVFHILSIYYKKNSNFLVQQIKHFQTLKLKTFRQLWKSLIIKVLFLKGFKSGTQVTLLFYSKSWIYGRFGTKLAFVVVKYFHSKMAKIQKIGSNLPLYRTKWWILARRNSPYLKFFESLKLKCPFKT